MKVTLRRILSPLRLPIPPPGRVACLETSASIGGFVAPGNPPETDGKVNVSEHQLNRGRTEQPGLAKARRDA